MSTPYNKITAGYVIQNYDENGNCIGQEFVAGDEVDYEDEDGNPIDIYCEEEYMPFDMIQPQNN